jgi:hypothetical protein
LEESLAHVNARSAHLGNVWILANAGGVLGHLGCRVRRVLHERNTEAHGSSLGEQSIVIL